MSFLHLDQTLQARVAAARTRVAAAQEKLTERRQLAEKAESGCKDAESDLNRAQQAATPQELSRSEAMHATLRRMVSWRPVYVSTEQVDMVCTAAAGQPVTVRLQLASSPGANGVRRVANVSVTPQDSTMALFAAMLQAADLDSVADRASLPACLASIETAVRAIGNWLRDMTELSLLQSVTHTFADGELRVSTTIVSYAKMCKAELLMTTSARAPLARPTTHVKVRKAFDVWAT